MPNLPAKDRFNKLVNDISVLYGDAKRSNGRFVWGTGQRIVEEEQNGEMRAVYGARLIPRLSEELTRRHGPGFSETTLKEVRLFFLQNRKSQPVDELPWGRHMQIMRLKDPRARESLQKRAIRENLGRDALRQIVSKVNQSAVKKPLPPLVRPTDLKLNTFKLAKPEVASLRKVPKGKVLVDCGFFVYRPVVEREVAEILTATPSYTYAALIERVIDGDTLVVVIDTGFENSLEEKLRLRGIDTPELGTPEGERAKKFVEKLLPPGSVIVLKSHKSRTDTYGRFVVDLFYQAGSDAPDEIIAEGAYLNQELIDKGLAVRMAE